MSSNEKSNLNRDTNPDPITHAPGSHPVATGIGAAAAGAAGAAIGSIVPGIGTVIGGVVGAIAGSVGGGYAGKAVGEMVDPTGEVEAWKADHAAAKRSRSFDEYRPAYEYGSKLATDSEETDFDENSARANWDSSPEARGLSFDSVKDTIRGEFNRKIKIREERLRADKERVSTGEVSLRKEVTTEMRTMEVPVEHEEVVITRHAVSGSSADAGTIDDDEEIRIPVSEERVKVSKETVVTGEVEVNKRTVQGSKTVSGEVRKENIRVDSPTGVNVDDRTKND